LLSEGNTVEVLDRFFFGEKYLESLRSKYPLTLRRDDIRWFDGSYLKGFDSVVDMAAISNDPAGELDPWKTLDINYLGRSRVARLAKEAGVSRYILVSSCSVYGFQDGILSEGSPPLPLTAYAKANLLAEQDNLILASGDFTSTVMRLATAYGLSHRMRFDVAINGMILGAVKNRKIPMMKDGTQWRPFVHVKDISSAVSLLMKADIDKINGQVFNTGADSQNYQIKALADIVASSLSVKPEIEWYGTSDNRSYRVSFEKVRRVLGFVPKFTPKEAVKEVEGALVSGEVSDSIETRTVEWYKHLLEDKLAGQRVAMNGAVL
jgi:nucleoside-diphosphate-sugar epimerase